VGGIGLGCLCPVSKGSKAYSTSSSHSLVVQRGPLGTWKPPPRG
jgi:hypothetical protein